MASVAAPTESTPSQPQSEFVKAMPLNDAMMLVAGSVIGPGIPVSYLSRTVEAGQPPSPPITGAAS